MVCCKTVLGDDVMERVERTPHFHYSPGLEAVVMALGCGGRCSCSGSGRRRERRVRGHRAGGAIEDDRRSRGE
jgi:hypothetical protein